MKQTIKLSLILVLLLSGLSSFSQKKFSEGTIVFDMDIQSDAEDMMSSMMPKEMVIRIKGTKSRTELEMGMMGSTIVLTDNKDNSTVTLMDIMGRKFAMKIDEKTAEEQRNKLPQYTIQETTETKDIAGYKCKKATLTDKNTKEVVTLYYTEQIPYIGNNMNNQFKGIKGFPMEYATNMNGVSMKIKVRSVTGENISDDLFTVSKEYKYVTQQELMNEFMGGGGDE